MFKVGRDVNASGKLEGGSFVADGADDEVPEQVLSDKPA